MKSSGAITETSRKGFLESNRRGIARTVGTVRQMRKVLKGLDKEVTSYQRQEAG